MDEGAEPAGAGARPHTQRGATAREFAAEGRRRLSAARAKSWRSRRMERRHPELAKTIQAEQEQQRRERQAAIARRFQKQQERERSRERDGRGR